jgi:hypothetical protein
MPHPAPQPTPAQFRANIVKFAHTLLGIHEIPPHSNSGMEVRRIQSATGAYGAPWCVSTLQYIWKNVLGTTWAKDTANAYYLAEFAEESGRVIAHPVPGCAVVYHIGQGHAGTVVSYGGADTFSAIEGNEADAVRQVLRNVKQIQCTFILRPELHL